MTTTTQSQRLDRKRTAQARRVQLSLQHTLGGRDMAERSVERILLEHFWRPARRVVG